MRLPIFFLIVALVALALRLTGSAGEFTWLVNGILLSFLLMFIVAATINAFQTRRSA